MTEDEELLDKLQTIRLIRIAANKAVCIAMRDRGGSFVAALGLAGLLADEQNLRRIKAAFPEYWAKYQEFVLEEE